eukprot:scaffold5347_cov130-Cylindrotheca_fusiformis.AAC.2
MATFCSVEFDTLPTLFSESKLPTKLTTVQKGISDSEHTSKTILIEDESESGSLGDETTPECVEDCMDLLDERIQELIEKAREALNSVDIPFSPDMSPSSDLDEKRLHVRRSMMRLHNRMRIAKTLGFGTTMDQRDLLKPLNVSHERSPVPILRMQKRLTLKALIRAFDSACRERSNIS